jgi:hypothetical protein
VKVQIGAGSRVETLRAKIQALTLIPTQSQRLIYKGKILKDGVTLEEIKVQSGDTIHLSSKPGGAAAAPAPAPSPQAAPPQQQPSPVGGGAFPAMATPSQAAPSPMAQAIQLLKSANAQAQYEEALKTMLKLAKNIIANPNETKYHTVKKGNATFNRKVVEVEERKCKHACMCMYMYVYVCIYIYIYMCMYVNVCRCTLNTCVCT